MKIWKIWLGSDEVPDHFNQYTETWDKISGGEIVTITDKNVHEWTGKTSFELADHFKGNVQVANHWLRYYLMFWHGGIYLDLDVEVIKDSEVWQNQFATFGFESKEWVNNHVMISNDNCRDIFDQLMYITYWCGTDFKKPEIDTGPGLVTKIWKSGEYYLKVLEPEVFSPWNWNEKPDRSKITENTLAVHHFTHSWKK